MQALLPVLLAVHLVIALFLIGLVMLQKSEGGALGIGGGGGGSLFSSRGVGSALTRATAILATAFFLTSIGLTMLSNQKGGSIVGNVPVQSAPATGGGTTAPADTGTGGGSAILPQLGGGTAPAAPAVPTGQ
ncbi:preprotein translocase subunit SecG [Aestuariivirga litoralis]|uniref:preprotein translocase subunit SecG n=1 Tax=Aestuariivirga litoralis TaxID=2650924 RepID=UPI0018C6E1C8|nr:preprotein translocase subunit SecG [Aestuariivirga litoralis]MBG1231536.1 preprotein translocase subunit SecG [Aestuariivirga litoralis]